MELEKIRKHKITRFINSKKKYEGKKYNRLKIIRVFPIDKACTRNALCLCDCGRKIVTRIHRLVSGNTRSCGCIRGYDGRRKRPEYTVWSSLISRCSNKNNTAYSYYGGRGIKVCKRWRESFNNFIADMGERPKKGKWTIERINNDGDYKPNNCKWATWKEQNNNKRKTAKGILKIKGDENEEVPNNLC